MKNNIIKKEYWYVIFSGMISGLIVFGGQILSNLGFSLLQISTIPYIFCLIVILPYFLSKKRKISRNIWGAILLFGLVEAGIVICQFAAPILGASIAVTALLLFIQPLWTTLASWIFFRRPPTKLNIIACALVLLGVVFIVNPTDLGESSSPIGILVAAIGGIFLSGWITMGSHLSKSGVKPIDTMFIGSALSVSMILLIAPFVRTFIADPKLVGFTISQSNLAWMILIAFGVVTFLINHFLYLTGTKKVSTVDAGIIMLFEPVIGSALAIIFFNQPLTWYILTGGALILLANYLVISKNRNDNG